ncbi:MAG TPA: helix-turn-helix transcriptional regulator [Candidatus Baltobacteraceae bacterium]|nr:helix-turn-helix transcriptional regulator [Candidatus Baltobacteraceae bacterium]
MRRRSVWPTREEVAWAADVGITWYTWLEQGRPIKIAVETLNRIAGALHLDVSETEYLHMLARTQARPSAYQRTVVSESTRGLVEGYAAGHAFVIDPLWELLAWNESAGLLFGVKGSTRGLECNGLWLIFTRKHLHDVLPDWKSVAKRMVATLRVERSAYVGNGAFDDLIASLSAVSSEFLEIWAEIGVLAPAHWTLGAVRNRASGDNVDYETVNLPIPDSPGQRLIFHYPKIETQMAAV